MKLLKPCYITATVLIFLLSDALLVILPTLISSNISFFLKGSVLLYYIVIAIHNLNIKEWLLLGLFVTIFGISQSYLLCTGLLELDGLIANLRFFIWYFFCLTLFFLHRKIYVSFQDFKSIKLLNKFAQWSIAVICISILIGFIFELKLFWTYNGFRWGYKGVLSKSVTASYFFIISLNYLYYSFVIQKGRYFFFFLTLFCSLLCGTKTIYAFLLLLLVFHIIKEKKYKLRSFWYFSLIFSGLLLFLRRQIVEKTKFIWGIFYELYLDKGFFYSITSFRSEMLLDSLVFYDSNWSWLNYLFGGRLLDIKYVEMSFFDLFYFFGALGFMLFLYTLLNYMVIPFLKKTQINGLFIITSIFMASFFTGQFFINSTVLILFFYYLLVIRLNKKIDETI